MKLLSLDFLPKLHTTPLSSVQVKNSGVIVEVDDEHERRVRFVLRPYQALRMTTADCFILPAEIRIKPQLVCEIVDSEWIAELKHNLSFIDESATFLQKAHHYLFPLQDDFLEIVAWDINVSSNAST